MPKISRKRSSSLKSYKKIGPKISDGIKNIGTREKRAKRIRFYHNGNIFFQGIVIPVSTERYGSIDNLMMDLTNIFGNKVTLPYGVRIIYSKVGRKVLKIEDLVDGEEYVCSAGESFKKLEYGKSDTLQLSKLTIPIRTSLKS